MRKQIIDALVSQYEAQIKRHKVNIENYMQNTVGVAEHPDIVDTIDLELAKLAEASDKLETLRAMFNAI